MHHHRFEVLDSFRGSALFVVVHHMHWQGSFTDWAFFRGSDLFVEFLCSAGLSSRTDMPQREPGVSSHCSPDFPLFYSLASVHAGPFRLYGRRKMAMAHKTVGFSFNNAPLHKAMHWANCSTRVDSGLDPWTNASHSTPRLEYQY